MTTTSRLYCEQPHPGSDQEAQDWHDRYHRSDLVGYRRTEAEFPELADLATFSVAWYRRWRELHLAKYPDADASTRANLDMFVEMVEARDYDEKEVNS